MNEQQRYGRMHAAFSRARDAKTAAARDALLTELCGEDLALREQVERMLRRDASLEESGGESRGQSTDAIDRWNTQELQEQLIAAPADITGEFGRYRIDKRVGEGGMGVVYRGTHLGLNRTVAIKMLRIAAPSMRDEQRLIQEGRLLASLDHPGLAAVFDIGTIDTVEGPQPFLVMQFIDGVPMREECAGREPLVIAGLMAQVCDAVGYAHARGVTHLDLKPANLLVEAPDDASGLGRPRVIDFGVARTRQELGDPAKPAAGGTPQYLSPEMVGGEEVGAWSDVHTLGLTLWELLCGKPPYSLDGCSFVEAASIIRAGVAEDGALLRAGVPKELAAVVLRALDPTPSLRYKNARDMASALRGCLGSSNPNAAPLQSQGDPPEGVDGAIAGQSGASSKVPSFRTLLWIGLSLLGFGLGAFAWTNISNARSWANSLAENLRSGNLPALVDASRFEPMAGQWMLDASTRTAWSAPNSGFADVVDRAKQGRLSEAQRRACAYLERDGFAAHPWLTRFVAAGIRGEAGWDRMRALALVARVCFENPANDQTAVAAAAPVRDAIWSVHGGLSPAEHWHALVLLAGCGTPSDAAQLAQWLVAADRETIGSSDDDALETVRLAMIAVHSIAQRSALCGQVAAWCRLADEDWFESLFRAAKPLEQHSLFSQVRLEISVLLLSDALTRRGADVAPLVGPAAWSEDDQLRAARGDSTLLDDWPGLLGRLMPMGVSRSYTLNGLSRVAQVLEFLRFGSNAASISDASLARYIDSAVDLAVTATLQGEVENSSVRDWAREQLDKLRAQARTFATGLRGFYDPDLDTHLGVTLNEAPTPLQEIPIEVDVPDPEGLYWHVTHGGVRVGFADQRVRWSHATAMRDEIHPELALARLGPGAPSALVLDFSIDGPTTGEPTLAISAIKAKRRYLPRFGRARLDVLLDNRRIGSVDIEGVAGRPIRLVLSPTQLSTGAHQLRLVLAEESTTTLRLTTVFLRGV